jgi:hypothetical protein
MTQALAAATEATAEAESCGGTKHRQRSGYGICGTYLGPDTRIRRVAEIIINSIASIIAIISTKNGTTLGSNSKYWAKGVSRDSIRLPK